MSKLENIRLLLQRVLAQFARISTDRALLEWDGEEELKVGDSVHGVDEEGNSFNLEDGEYTADDKTVYVIKEGKVEEIREADGVEEDETTGDDVQPEDETKDEEMSKNYSLFHRMAMSFESFREKEDKIRAALADKGIECWLVDAGDDFVIGGVWSDESMQDHFWKYSVSWDEEGNAIIGEGVEVKSEFVPVEKEKSSVDEEFDDKDDKISNLEQEVARLTEELGAAKEENDQLKAQIKELEEKSAASSASEEFEKITKTEKTGNKRIDNLSRILNA